MTSVLMAPATLLFLSVFALYVIQLPMGGPWTWRKVVFWVFFILLLVAFILTFVRPGGGYVRHA
jgi:hypothetical protein